MLEEVISSYAALDFDCRLLIMMGYHARSEALFCYFRVEDQLPENHLLRLIDRHISFEFVRQQPKDSYSEAGRPSVDPELLLRILLIGYLYGISSEHKLVEELRMHLAWRWFTGLGFDQEIPHHSTFSKEPGTGGLGNRRTQAYSLYPISQLGRVGYRLSCISIPLPERGRCFVQHRIREFCKQLMAATNPEEVQPIAEELQAAIHEHIEDLRLSLVALTVLPSETSGPAA